MREEARIGCGGFRSLGSSCPDIWTAFVISCNVSYLHVYAPRSNALVTMNVSAFCFVRQGAFSFEYPEVAYQSFLRVVSSILGPSIEALSRHRYTSSSMRPFPASFGTFYNPPLLDSTAIDKQSLSITFYGRHYIIPYHSTPDFTNLLSPQPCSPSFLASERLLFSQQSFHFFKIESTLLPERSNPTNHSSPPKIHQRISFLLFFSLRIHASAAAAMFLLLACLLFFASVPSLDIPIPIRSGIDA